MADQGAALGLDQQVLGAAADMLDALAGQPHVEVFGNRPAQAALAHDHAGHPVALQMRGDTAAGGFDFGQFGHGGGTGSTGAANIAGSTPACRRRKSIKPAC
ncbi:hypothetical protein D3C78_1212200 [compost metagenome]